MLALVGKFNLDLEDEFGSKALKLLDIISHDDWNHNSDKYDSDLAIAVLLTEVEFSDQIQPVCLPMQSYSEVKGTGMVVGWGKSESSGPYHEKILKQLESPAVNGSHCFTMFPELAKAASTCMFCGGFADKNKSACLGDSGSGFYFENKKSKNWIVKGIVSGALRDAVIGCNINAFTLYTNVARFVDWINEKMEETMDATWEIRGLYRKPITEGDRQFDNFEIIF